MNMIDEAEIFVFNKEGKTSDEWHTTLDRDFDRDVDALPFKTIAIENNEKNGQICGISQLGSFFLLCMLVREKIVAGKPEFDMVWLMMEKESGFHRVVAFSTDLLYDEDDQSMANANKHLLDLHIKDIHEGKEGSEPTNQTIKIKRKGMTPLIKRINKVVHIAPKKEIDSVTPVQPGKVIDWSHSWLVRGHWRRIKGIGKDREGNYCINGQTFVVPHQKGTGEVVKKVRIVD